MTVRLSTTIKNVEKVVLNLEKYYPILGDANGRSPILTMFHGYVIAQHFWSLKNPCTYLASEFLWLYFCS